jgi:hypothetical protein
MGLLSLCRWLVPRDGTERAVNGKMVDENLLNRSICFLSTL